MKNDRILLDHGAGGIKTHELIRSVFRPAFANRFLNAMDDSAALPLALKSGETLAFTTDSFVVDPLFFPGGDIGKLAVCGTVNDLAMKGAAPRAISLAAVIEEGLDMALLKKVTASAAAAAREAGVPIVTGDTKVVDRGKADKLFLTSSGIGIVPRRISLSGAGARPGDAVLINGPIGDHGAAVLAARNDLKISAAVKSDCAPLNGLVNRLLAACPKTHVLRDPTRGGLATTLNEIAESSGCGIVIDETLIPVRPAVRSLCNLLGLDPLYVANEGKVIAILPGGAAATAVKAMRLHRYGKGSAVIGEVVKKPRGLWLKTAAGGLRPLIMLEGNQLPRIC